MRGRWTGLVVVPLLAVAGGGIVPADTSMAAGLPRLLQIAQLSQPEASSPTTPVVETPAAETPAPVDVKTDASIATEKLLGDASALRARYREFRTGKSRQAVPLYEFRTMEQRLNKPAEAEPNNSAVADLANAMRMIQGEILGPAVQRSMIVKRKMFADRAATQPGMKVSVTGPGNTTVRFVSPGLTRATIQKLDEDAKIFEQLRMLDFRSAVFTDGRRNRYTYIVASQRLR